MQQLSGIDASFLNMETATTFGHVSSLNIYDPTDAPGGAGYEATKAAIGERLHLLAPFRRRPGTFGRQRRPLVPARLDVNRDEAIRKMVL